MLGNDAPAHCVLTGGFRLDSDRSPGAGLPGSCGFLIVAPPPNEKPLTQSIASFAVGGLPPSRAAEGIFTLKTLREGECLWVYSWWQTGLHVADQRHDYG
jgi:hypothetical protein